MSSFAPMTLAIVDDDDDVRNALHRLLRALGHHVVGFASAEAFETGAVVVDCVIVDMRLPGLSGLELRDRLRQPDAAHAGRARHRRRRSGRRRPVRCHRYATREQALRRSHAGHGDRAGHRRLLTAQCQLTIATSAPPRRAASGSGTGTSPPARSTSIPCSRSCSATRTTRSATTSTTGAGTSIPTTPPRVLERAQAHINGEVPAYEVEHRMVHRDGSVRWFIARGQVVRDGNGTAIGMAGTDTDITARKRSEEALRQAEELNRRIVESSGDCVKILALDGRLLYMNPEGVRALEMADASELLQRPLAGFFDGEVRQRGRGGHRRGSQGGRGRFQYLMPTATGRAEVVGRRADADHRRRRPRRPAARRLARHHRAAARRGLPRRAAPGAGDDCHRQPAAGGARQRGPPGRAARPAACSAPSCCSTTTASPSATARRPSMPAGYLEALSGLTIGPRAGSCGTAMYLGQPVIVTDILTDPLWEDYLDVAVRFGFRACWSTPIFSPDAEGAGLAGDVLRAAAGAAAGRMAADRDRRRHRPHRHRAAARASQALQHSEARNQAILRAIPDWMFLTTLDGVFLDFHARDATRCTCRRRPSSAGGSATCCRRTSPTRWRWLSPAPPPPDEPEKIEYTLGSDDNERFYEAMIVTLRRRQDPQHRPGHHRPQARRARGRFAPARTGPPRAASPRWASCPGRWPTS